jgi:hypothetical protein
MEAEIQLRQLESIIPDFGPETLARLWENFPPELRQPSLETLRSEGFLPLT